MTRELTDILQEQASLYEEGDELTSEGILEAPGWRVFDNQIELVKKVKHLNEFNSDSETARRALMIGLNLMAADFVDEEQAEQLKNQMMDSKGGEE